MKDRNLLKPEVIKLLEYRIQQEEFSSRLYQDMHLWFADKGLNNLAAIYKEYASEEMEHAGWAKEFLLSFGVKPKLQILPSPESGYKECYEILEATLEHEIDIKEQCEELAKEALKMGEMSLYTLAFKYVDEQIDEIDKAYDFLSIYEMTSDKLVFDEYIGKQYLKA